MKDEDFKHRERVFLLPQRGVKRKQIFLITLFTHVLNEFNQVRRVGADEDCSIANGLTSTR
jgi:hypothetical protein